MNGEKRVVLVPQNMSSVGLDFLREKGYKVRVESGNDEQALIRDVTDCDALFVRVHKVTSKVIESGQKLVVIARHGIGLENIDVEYASKKGIWVVNTPIANFNAVAEHTMVMVLDFAKRTQLICREYRKGDESTWQRNLGSELSGKTLGILG